MKVATIAEARREFITAAPVFSVGDAPVRMVKVLTDAVETHAHRR